MHLVRFHKFPKASFEKILIKMFCKTMDISLNTLSRNNCLPLLKVSLILTFLLNSFSFFLISARNFVA